ncbi:MAG: PhnD/SsuA/transferrin family substrate-binding protein [Xanthomonadales bacterium]|nr:PhnD/SsuA/transferrin family substrate-binding protein [Xanthomonadales bacterium]
MSIATERVRSGHARSAIRLTGPLVALLAVISLASARADDFSITIEPNYPPDQLALIYKPLLDYLDKSTGHHFELVTTRNYHFYWRDLRNATPVDFTIEDAPFVEYRMLRQQFVPLARVAEPTSYRLIAQPDYADNGIDGLIGYRVACLPSPSMGIALLNGMYTNPLAQPEVKSEATSWREAVEIVFAGEGEAAMVPRHIADLYPNLVEVAASKEFPGITVSAASSVPEDVRIAVRDALLALHEDESLYEVLVEIGASRFVPAAAEDYAGSEEVLSGTFGYKPPPAGG